MTTIESYIHGQPVLVTAVFDDLDADTEPDEPGTVTLRIKDGAGTVTIVEEADLDRDEATVDDVDIVRWSYLIDTAAGSPGVWKYRFEGAGGLTAVTEQRFRVRRSAFTADELADGS